MTAFCLCLVAKEVLAVCVPICQLRELELIEVKMVLCTKGAHGSSSVTFPERFSVSVVIFQAVGLYSTGIT